MEGLLLPTDQQSMVSSFLEIAVGQTAETATLFLQATSWKLEDAIQLFYVGNEGGAAGPPSIPSPPTTNEQINSSTGQTFNESGKHVGAGTFGQYEDQVRPPLPVIREALYDDAMLYGTTMSYLPNESGSSVGFRNLQNEVKHHDVWNSEEGAASTSGNSRDNLASLYRPPNHLMFNGPFEKAKGAACVQDKWLVVNLQSTKEFSSHMLNRDTWANEAVSQTITTNFIFWQVYDDSTEGQKVCTYYKLESIPAVLVIDPITGQKMHSWFGMVQPERLLEDLLPFMDGCPKYHHVTLSHKRPRESSLTPPKVKEEDHEEDEEVQRALAVSLEGIKEMVKLSSEDNKDAKTTEKEEERRPTYPPLAEEPKGDRNLLCRIGVRLPNGRRCQRNFLRTDPIQLLWSFCSSQLEEGETKLFKLTHAIPGATEFLDYDTKMTFEESGLANSMISVTWD
ncbi:plant UBX domain-containing protein 7-like [Cucurbita pepo subsp. pepo]|uniref:plant UBX domain-containing protein 7-like n=1 Tax=Cucurbita pepo subsp. pepo TaxID=3664 RepID=UPI000C9D7FDB|nr:plant UBX domain-containing protein 7-like [Cucurbita pepo subsp. pepo]